MIISSVHAASLCFFEYLNAYYYALKYSKITMYADHTRLAYSVKSVSDVSNVMNYELESLYSCTVISCH